MIFEASIFEKKWEKMTKKSSKYESRKMHQLKCLFFIFFTVLFDICVKLGRYMDFKMVLGTLFMKILRKYIFFKLAAFWPRVGRVLVLAQFTKSEFHFLGSLDQCKEPTKAHTGHFWPI
mmetsp:Transcript_20913/g.27494  ORF Transcript_20913/g.27494 Transcript_20913/m.27494 type:complete len:119 (+) Transcript_20913:324-680(+)